MPEGPDVLGSDREPREPLPRWVRLLAVGATGLAVAGWVAVPHLRHRPPTPPPRPASSASNVAAVGDEYHCGAAGRDGMGWSVPQFGGSSDGRVAVATVLACNTGPRPATVLSLSAAGRGRADLSPQQYAELTGSGRTDGPPGTVSLPAEIPAGGRARLASASVLLDCAGVAATFPPLQADVRIEGGDTGTDAILTQQSSDPGFGWCTSPPGSMERTGPLQVTVNRGRRTVDLGVRLLNPNAEPVQLDGIDSPSPGVRVLSDNLHGRTVPAGGTVSVTARFLVERCDSVFVDGPWSLPARALGTAAATPVRLAASPWQLAAVRTLCPGRQPLRQARGPAVLEVTLGGVASGQVESGRARLELSSQVLNAGHRALLLTRRQVAVPAAVLKSVSVRTGNGGQGLMEPLTRFSLPVGASATLTMTYDAPANLVNDCGASGWPAPVAVSDSAGRPQVVKVIDGVTNAGPGWVGSWLLSSGFGCPPQQEHRGTDPPFLVSSSPPQPSGRSLPLALFGLPGLPAATVVDVRPVGVSADVRVVASGLPTRIAPGREVSLSLTQASCADGVDFVRVAVSYRVAGRTGVPPPLLVDLPGCGLR